MNYYYRTDSQTVGGPHNIRVIQAMIESGELPLNTQICQGGTAGWRPFSAEPSGSEPPAITTTEENPKRWGNVVGNEVGRLGALLVWPGVFVHPNIPLPKINGAQMSYASALLEIEDMPMVLVDSTIFGSAENGMILAMQTLFWKNRFCPPLYLPLYQVSSAVLVEAFLEKKIMINGNIPIEIPAGLQKETGEAIASLISTFARPDNLSLLHEIWKP